MKKWPILLFLAIISCKNDDPAQPRNTNNPPVDTTLSTPVLISPAANDSTLNKRPRFIWTKSKNATSYDLQVSSYNFFPDSSNYSMNLSDTTFSFNLDLPTRILFWRVRSVRQSFVSAWSITRSFKIYDTVPPVDLSPPIIDGTINTIENYTLIGTYGPGKDSTGFGPHGVIHLYAKKSNDKITFFLAGNAESNGNNLAIYLGASGVAGGITAGSQLPAADDPDGCFDASRPTLDFECDMAIRIGASGDNGGSFYMSAVNYAAPVASKYIDVYLGNQPNNGTTRTVNQIVKQIGGVNQAAVTTFNNIRTAFVQTANLNSNTALDKGWEIEIPRSAVGNTGTLKIIVSYFSGSGDFWSANTIPAKPNNGSNNLAGNPNLVVAGTQMHINITL